jgi:hypothetical protein
MEDAAWSPYDSSFRSSYLAGDPARSEALFPDMKINTLSGEYSFPWTSSAGSGSPAGGAAPQAVIFSACLAC